MGSDDDHNEPPRLYPHKNGYDLNSKIMLTAIISLSLVVVLVIILHVYARCVLRRQARQRAVIRHLGLAVAHPSEPPKTGLDSEVIASLPIIVCKRSGDDTEIIECAVCLSLFEEEEISKLLPNCKHTFHLECIDKWLTSNSTCPICRTEAEPRLETVSHETVATAPPLESVNSTLRCAEGSSDGAVQSSAKIGNSSSRLSSFRRILSRERSSRRIQYGAQEDGIEDLERQ